MREARNILTLIFLAIGISLFGQMKKANKLYDELRFIDAIEAYSKVLKKDDKNAEALRKIADCYRVTKQYEQAELFYSKAFENDDFTPKYHMYFGQVLKNNGKVSEARKQFELASQKDPNSFLAKLLIQSCDNINTWKKESPLYEVSKTENINSEVADFSPTTHPDGLVFVTEREKDYINDVQYGWTNKPFLTVYIAEYQNEEKTSFDKPKRFSNKIDSRYHDGPVTFNPDCTEIYFTRVERTASSKKEVSNLKIYKATYKKKKLTKFEPFEYNGKDYSVAHPCVSDDGNYFFFASDMPGGQGGMDLYMCEKTENGWGEPKNLGSGTNSPGNELFPYHKKGKLYFSSDGLPGYGGLDIFVTEKKDNYNAPKNLRDPLNSRYDDFGITMTDDTHGFFSSNRDGGQGDDDIYAFTKLPEKEKEKTTVKGVFEYEGLGASGVNLNLLDENDAIVASTKTNEKGEFSFESLNIDENYMIVVNENDIPAEAKMFITNKEGKKVMEVNRFRNDAFKFEALSSDEIEQMPIIEEKDESLLTISVYGQIYDQLPGDYSGGMDVYVVNDKGIIIGTAKTDKDGKFVFEKLPPDEQYLFKLAEEKDLNIIILDENGEVVDSPKRKGKGYFVYTRLSGDDVVLTLINEEDVVIKIKEDENFIISNIYYDYNSAEIKESAAKELDKLVLILKKNTHIGVELSSHTDSRGGDEFNLSLSQKRAEKAVQYIVGKGIEIERMKGVGYGETKLVNKCSNGVECTEEEHGKNRRTEFKVYKVK